MANNEVIFKLKGIGDFSDIKSGIQNLQKYFKGLSLPDNVTEKLQKGFSNLEKEVVKYQKFLNSGFKTKADVTGLERSGRAIEQIINSLQDTVNDLDFSEFKNALKLDTSKITEAENKIKELKKQISKKLEAKIDIGEQGKENLVSVNEEIKKMKKLSKSGKILEIEDILNSGDIDLAKQKLEEFKGYVDTAFKNNPTSKNDLLKYIENIKTVLSQIGPEGITALYQQIKSNQGEMDQAINGLNQLAQTSFESVTTGVKQLATGFHEVNAAENEAANTTRQMSDQMEQLKHRAEYFFGIAGAARLARQAIRQLWQETQELDKAMTETAVVTDFSVGDMWEKLPEYTKNAKALGVATKELYEATTLYYQQGLKGNEVMNIGVETLKLARIAGLEAANATDLMTTALRGFNMEINEDSAKRVSDTYAALAANSASNVQELATAMSKTASIAASVGAEFENIAVFLAQGIETTRESADNIGTAMKTVLARFNEMKKDPAEIMDVEGEAVDVNRVETALRSAGIALRDTNGQFREADKVLLEVAEKWNSLTLMQQRYIATQAAGSRQQSRFIAMMSDYNRTLELQNVALNSAGASQKQYQKTQESLETKVARLKDTWQQFILGLANDKVIKGVVDTFNKLLERINSLSNLPGIFGSISKGLLALGIFKGGGKVVDGLMKAFSAGNAAKTAEGFSKGFTKSLKTSLVASLNGLKKIFSKEFFITPEVDTKIFKVKINEIEVATQELRTKLSNPIQLQLDDYEIDELNEKLVINETILRSTTKQRFLYAAAIQDGIPEEIAELALTEESSEAFLKAAKSKLIEEGATEADADAKLKNIAATAGLNSAEKMGILTKIKNYTLLLFGNKETRESTILRFEQAGATWAAKKAEDGFNASLLFTQVALGPIIIAVLALTTAIAGLVIAAAHFIPEKQFERAAEATQQASDAAEEAKENYNDLLNSLDELKDKYKSFDELIKGTQEWDNAVQDVNSSIIDLIDKYKELAQFVEMDTEGRFVINYNKEINGQTAQGVIDSYQEKTIAATAAEIAAKAYESQKQQNAEFASFKKGNYNLYSADERLTQVMGGAIAGSVVAPGIGTLIGAISGLLGAGTYGKEQENNKEIAKLVAQGKIDEAKLKAERYGYSWNDSEDAIKALKSFGEELLTSEKQIEVYNKALTKDAADLANINNQYSNEQYNRMINAVSSEQMEEWKEQERKNIQGSFFGVKDSLEGDYKAFFKELYGDTVKVSAFGGITYTKDGEKKKIDADAAKAQYAAAKATENASVKMASFVEGLDKLGNAGSQISKLFDDETGLRTTKEDINNIEDIGAIWNKLDTEAKKFFDNSYKNFEKEIVKRSKASNEALKEASERIENIFGPNSKITQSFEDLTVSFYADQKKGLSNQMAEIYAASGETGGKLFLEEYKNILNSLKTDELKKVFIDQFNQLDLSDIDSIRSFSDNLEALKVKIPKNEINNFEAELIKLAGAIKQVNLENLKRQIQEIQELVNNIEDKDFGDRSFTQEEAEQIIKYSDGAITSSDFTGLGDNLTYVGNSVQELIPILKARVAQELKEQKSQLEKEINTGEIIERRLESFKKEKGYAENENTWSPKQQLEFLKELGQENTGLSDSALNLIAKRIDSKGNWKNGTDSGIVSMLDNAWNNIISSVTNLETNRIQRDMVNQQLGYIQYMDKPTATVAKDMTSNDEEVSKMATNAMIARAHATGELEGEIQKLRDAEDKYADEIQKAASLETKQRQNAERSAKAKLNDARAELARQVALKETQASLNKTYEATEDYFKILESDTASSSEKESALSNIIKAAKNFLGLNIDEEFLNAGNNLEKFKKMLESAPDSDDGLINWFNDLNIEEAAAVLGFDQFIREGTAEWDAFSTFIQQNPAEALVTGSADMTELIQGMYDAAVTAGTFTGTIEDYLKELSNLGVEFDIEYETKLIDVEEAGYTLMPGEKTTKKSNLKKKISVPKIVGKFKDNNGGGGSSSAAPASTPSNTSKSNDTYEPDIDPLYNEKQKLVSIQDKLNKAENKYNTLLLDQNASLSDQIAAYREITKLKEEEAAQTKRLAELSVQAISDLENENKDLFKYGHYDLTTGVWVINQSEIAKLKGGDSEFGERVEKYNSKGQEYADQAREYNQQYDSQILEIAERNKRTDTVFEKHLNELQKIADLEQEQSQIQNKYNRLLKQRVVSSGKLYRAQQEELVVLDDIIKERGKYLAQTEQDMLTKAAELMASGNDKYINIDTKTGSVTLDEESVRKLSDAEQELIKNVYEAVKQVGDKFKEANEAYESAIDAQIDKLAEIRSSSIEAISKLREAVVANYQKMIDSMSTINDSINDSNSKLLDSIQKNINQMRQDRENEKEEQELRDKEAELAYLMQDTTGANALRIQELQKELEEGKESYTDKLIDQKISQLQDQNNEAAEQRQEQIDILTKQLELYQNSGLINNEINSLFRTGIDETGGFVSGSELEKIVKEFLITPGLTEIEQQQQLNDLAPLFTSLKNYMGTSILGDPNGPASDIEKNTEDISNNVEEIKRAVTSEDVRNAARITFELDDIGNYSKEQIAFFDTNGDGKITAEDVSELMKRLASGKKYATGGLADFTGPAWLDGTSANPELVLNAQDTQNFIILKDILSDILTSSTGINAGNGGDNYFDIHIEVEKIDSDYDVDNVAERVKTIIKEDAMYRNVNIIDQW